MLLTLLHCALAATPPGYDADAAGWEAVQLASLLLQVDSSNPPGNETRAAAVLQGWLDSAGIENRVFEETPGRGNLVARIEGSGDSDTTLCLVSHLDVASVEPEHWDHPPFSGLVDEEGQVWGRGALDMKGMAVIETLAMVWIARLGIELEHDVVLLALADEEVDNAGVQYMIREHWDELRCTHAINEGGLGIRDMLFPGQDVYPITVGEKGVLWVKLTAHGHAGHGSTPLPGEAPARLLDALDRLRAWQGKPQWDPSLLALLDAVGADHGGAAGFVLKHPALVKTLLRGTLMDNPITRAALTDTIHVTGMEGAHQPNVVPSEVSANLDCRLQPKTSPDQMLALVLALVDDENVTAEVLSAMAGAVSPVDDPLFEAIARNVVTREGAVAGPALSVGFTDSNYLRIEKGVHAYGLVPFSLTAEELAGMHGPNERVPASELQWGLGVMLGIVLDFAGG